MLFLIYIYILGIEILIINVHICYYGISSFLDVNVCSLTSIHADGQVADDFILCIIDVTARQ